jgi:ABC-2 type transport system ATP-binding protein
MVTRQPVLTARALCKRFGRRTVLGGADFEVAPGEIVGICGENGAGKTTLVRILAGVLKPNSGEVRRPQAMGYVPQMPLLYEHLSPWEHFRYFAAAHGIETRTWPERARALLAFYRFENWAHERVSALSGGTKQKLNLALSLLSDPSLVLLDEPYGGLEWETYLRFWEHVSEMQERGKAVVVVSHLFYDRAKLDRILELRDGVLQAA